MFSILLSSSFVYSLSPEFSYSISSFSSFIIFIVLHPLTLFSFRHLQFFFSLFQYSSLYCLSDYLNNFFAINHPSSSFFLNISSFLSCCLYFPYLISISFYILLLLLLHSLDFSFLPKYLILL